MTEVRTRFAPSPTGFLHVGSARTALFNRAVARRHGGRFVLRIEDTDRERSTRESEQAVLEGLHWLGIDWDEGPFRQSERAERYAEAVEKLLRSDRAYRCRCAPEQIDERRQKAIAEGRKWVYDGRCRDLALGPDCGPHTIRLRLPAQGRLDFDDLVFGPSGQDVREIGDMIIRRSDGQPLYNLAVVVDDLEMGISHVIRGADHHINTPFQVALYRALDAEPPHFAHVPLIVNAQGKKLSKRRDPVSVQQYREDGYLPDALRNWLIRIGWSHGDQEIFEDGEICELFELDHVNRANAQADPDKLLWLNQHYLKSRSREQLMADLEPFLVAAAGHPVELTPGILQLVDLLRERARTLADMAEQARFAVVEEIAYDEKAASKHLRKAIEAPLAELHDRLAALETWTEAALEAVFETLVALGKSRSVSRIAEALHEVRHG